MPVKIRKIGKPPLSTTVHIRKNMTNEGEIRGLKPNTEPTAEQIANFGMSFEDLLKKGRVVRFDVLVPPNTHESTDLPCGCESCETFPTKTIEADGGGIVEVPDIEPDGV